MSEDMTDGNTKRTRNSNKDKMDSEIQRTSSFKDRMDTNGSTTPGDVIGVVFTRQAAGSPTRGTSRRSFSPLKSYSPTRDRSSSNSPRRERSYLRASSPDKPLRRSAIWSQWEQSKKRGEDCLQEFNIKQMESLYGRELGGKVEAAQDWYRVNGLNRSKTQMEAIKWLTQQAVQSATGPVSFTPRGTQTESVFHPRSRSLSPSKSSSHMSYAGSPYKNREMKTRELLKDEKNLNKLSHRHRVQRTPSIDDIRKRESKFTNDAIVTERRRTRFKDIIPQYDASADRHCKAYFKRRDVQDLINVTRSREPNELLDYWQRKNEIARQYTLYGFKDDGI